MTFAFCFVAKKLVLRMLGGWSGWSFYLFPAWLSTSIPFCMEASFWFIIG
jgi:hypothetical protein